MEESDVHRAEATTDAENHGSEPAVILRREEIFEVLTNEEEEECLMQVVSAAAGPVRCGGSAGYQMEDECASSTSSHICVGICDNLSQTVYGKAPMVWEMFCGTHNNLSQSCEKLCLKPMNQPLQRRL